MMMMAEAFDTLVALMVEKLNESAKTADTAREEADQKSADRVSDIATGADEAKSEHVKSYDDGRDANIAKYTAEYNEAKKGLLSQVYDASAMDGLDTLNMPLFVDAMLTAQGNVNDAIAAHADSISESILKEVNRRGWFAEYVENEYTEGGQTAAKEALEGALAGYQKELAVANDSLAKANEDKAAREEEWANEEAALKEAAAGAAKELKAFVAEYEAGGMTNQEYYADLGALEEQLNNAEAELNNSTEKNDRAAKRDDNSIAFYTERADAVQAEIAKKNAEIAATIEVADADKASLQAHVEELTASRAGLEEEIDATKADKANAEKEAKEAVSEADDAYTAAKAAYDEANDADPNSPATSAALKDMGDKYLVLKTKEDDFSDAGLPFAVNITHMEARSKTYAMEIEACNKAIAAIDAFTGAAA